MKRVYKRQVRLTPAEENRINAFLKANSAFEDNFSLLARAALRAFLESPSMTLQKTLTLDDYVRQKKGKRERSGQIKALFGKRPLSRKKRDPLKAILLRKIHGED